MLLFLLPGWVGAQSDPPVPSIVEGEMDSDCDVDRLDLNIVLAARNTPAVGDDDPRDLDGDGMITVLDARKLVLLCTQPRCAILQSSCEPTNEPPKANAGPDQTLTLARLSLFGGCWCAKQLKRNDLDQKVFTTDLKFPAEISGGGWGGSFSFSWLSTSCYALSGLVCRDILTSFYQCVQDHCESLEQVWPERFAKR